MSRQPPRLPRYELWRSDTDGLYRVRVRASNGRVLASSEGYRRRRDAARCAVLLAWVGEQAEVRDLTGRVVTHNLRAVAQYLRVAEAVQTSEIGRAPAGARR